MDQCTLVATGASGTRSAGRSLAYSLPRKPVTIVLHGELGAGKTTFVQGFAEGLGIKTNVVSPTYALEQRYGEILSHIDLYRLDPKKAEDFMAHHAEEFPGIRTVEWAERDATLRGDISVEISELGTDMRRMNVTFKDIRIPTQEDLAAWIRDVRLPTHIVKHMQAVADVAAKVADHLVKRGAIIRPKALHAACMTHDLLRFVDFKTWAGDGSYEPSDADRKRWGELKNEYGTPHESAAKHYLTAKGFPEIGTMVEHHRGYERGVGPLPLKTTEALILAYADKRVKFDEFVTLDERFDDFKERYGKGVESEDAKAWRAHMKKIETDLFGPKIPF